jgi:hypothetical protein
LIGFSTDKGFERIRGKDIGDIILRVERYPYGTWALADPEFAAAKSRAPGSELRLGNLFTVFTTSPLEERYKEFAKQRNATLLVMDPFSWEEFLFAA